MATLKTLEEFGVNRVLMTPKMYTVRLGIPAAYRWVDRIRAMGEGDSQAAHSLFEVSGGAVNWQPADMKEHGIREIGAYGEFILVVRATSEHDADRVVRKILARAELEATRPTAAVEDRPPPRGTEAPNTED